MGPKTVALLWDAAKIGSIDQLSEAIEAGRLAGLPRMGDKQIEKLRKGIDDYRRSAGRFRIDVARRRPGGLRHYLLANLTGIEKVTPAGSLRRGRETVGDLDLLATGPACEPEHTAAAVEHVAAYPGIHDMIAKGENKVSFHVEQGLQVDVRLLPSASYGAALQYFTGSKAHNVALRQRALKMGYTLSEWALARLDDELDRGRGHRGGDLRRSGHGLDAAGDARKPGRDRGCGRPQNCHSLSSRTTSAATCTCTPRPATAATRSAKWPKPPSPAATSTSPSPTTRKTWP